MSIFNRSADNTIFIDGSDPAISIDDLVLKYNASVDSNDNVELIINPGSNQETITFNTKTPTVYKVNGNEIISGNVYNYILGQTGESIIGGNLPEAQVTASRIVNLKDDNSFRYKDPIESTTYDISKIEKTETPPVNEGKTPPSLMNKWSLMRYRGLPEIKYDNGFETGQGFDQIYRKAQPLQNHPIDTASLVGYMNSRPTIYPVSYNYNYSDFALAKYNNRIPNNRLLTLRRFAGPVEDDIITQERKGKDGKPNPINFPPIAQAVTWFDEATENNINEILKFSMTLNTESIESGLQEIQRNSETGGVLNSLASKLPLGVRAALNGRNVVDQSRLEAEGDSFDPLTATYPNYVLGPYNVIKDMLIRKSGISSSMEIKLTFEYKMRYFPGANPKILFLDQLANILSLTYNTAPFWGGAVRYTGGYSQVTPPLGDLDLLRNGDLKGFASSIFKDAANILNNAFNFDSIMNDIKGGNIKEVLSNFQPLLTNLIGGRLLDLVNTPQGGMTIKALLTGEATGQWHLTVGNPFEPIAMIGNLMCTDTEIIFDGPLGMHDFPEEMKVVVTLKPGRPRDKGEIESMFNCGRGRLYIEPAGAFTNGLDINAEAGAPLKPEQIEMLKKMSNG